MNYMMVSNQCTTIYTVDGQIQDAISIPIQEQKSVNSDKVSLGADLNALSESVAKLRDELNQHLTERIEQVTATEEQRVIANSSGESEN